MPTPPQVDPFRRWLQQQREQHGRPALAQRLQVTPPTISNWLNGKTVSRDRVKLVQLEAAKDGVILTAEELLGIPSHSV